MRSTRHADVAFRRVQREMLGRIISMPSSAAGSVAASRLRAGRGAPDAMSTPLRKDHARRGRRRRRRGRTGRKLARPMKSATKSVCGRV